MKECVSCGTEVPHEVQACTNCGASAFVDQSGDLPIQEPPAFSETPGAPEPTDEPLGDVFAAPISDAPPTAAEPNDGTLGEAFGASAPDGIAAEPPTKSRAWIYISAGIVVALFVGAFFMRSSLAFLFGGNETTSYVPADAQFYVVLDLVEMAQGGADARVSSLLTEIDETFGLDDGSEQDFTNAEEEILDEIASAIGVDALDLSFTDDVASWTDRYIAAFGSIRFNEAAEPDGEACFLVQARSKNEADAALERIYTELSGGDLTLDRRETNDGIVYEWTDELTVQASRVDDVVALCVGEGLLGKVVAAHESGETLETNETFVQLQDALGEWAIFAYADTEGLIDSAMDFEEFEGFISEQTPRAQYSMTTNLTAAGFEFKSATLTGDLPYELGSGLAAAEALPGDVYLAVGGVDLGAAIQTAFDTYQEIPEIRDGMDNAFAEFEAETGVDPEALVDSMVGPYGMALSAHSRIEGFPIGFVMFTDLSDRTPIDDLVTYAGETAGVPFEESNMGPYQVTTFDIDVTQVGVGMTDSRFVLAVEEDIIEQMTSGDVLSEDPRFMQAAGFLAEGDEWIGCVDVAKVIEATLDEARSDIRSEDDGDDIITAMEIAAARFPYFVAGVDLGEEVTTQTFVIVFAQGFQ